MILPIVMLLLGFANYAFQSKDPLRDRFLALNTLDMLCRYGYFVGLAFCQSAPFYHGLIFLQGIYFEKRHNTAKAGNGVCSPFSVINDHHIRHRSGRSGVKVICLDFNPAR